MDKNKLIQTILILIIVILALISVWMLVGFKNKAINQYQNTLDFVPMVDGKQMMKMTIDEEKYSPEYFKVKTGVPVRWEITSFGQASCNGGPIIAEGLLNGRFITAYLIDGDQIYLNPDANQITVVEFIGPTPGLYRFDCQTKTNVIGGTIESNN